MYELKKNGKVFTSKFVGTGPSSFETKNLPGRGLTKVEKHCFRELHVKACCRAVISWYGAVYMQRAGVTARVTRSVELVFKTGFALCGWEGGRREFVWTDCGHVTYLLSAWQQAAVFVACRLCSRVNCVQFAHFCSMILKHVRARHRRRSDNEAGSCVCAGLVHVAITFVTCM